MSLRRYQIDQGVDPIINSGTVYATGINNTPSMNRQFNPRGTNGYATALPLNWNIQKGYKNHNRVGNTINIKNISGLVTISNIWHSTYKYTDLENIGSSNRLFRVSVLVKHNTLGVDSRWVGIPSVPGISEPWDWGIKITPYNEFLYKGIGPDIAQRSLLHTKLFKGIDGDHSCIGVNKYQWPYIYHQLEPTACYGNPITAETPEDYTMLFDKHITLSPTERTTSTIGTKDGPDECIASATINYDIDCNIPVTYTERVDRLMYPDTTIMDNTIMVVVSTNHIEGGWIGWSDDIQKYESADVRTSHAMYGRHWWKNSATILYEE